MSLIFPADAAIRSVSPMIQLTRINGQPILLNADLIEFIETTPDTVITLTTTQKFMVQEPPDAIVGRIVEFKRRLAGQFGGADGNR